MADKSSFTPEEWSGQQMAKDRDKRRVTFYYLLAEKYGKLAAFSK
jgi:hypothetical protein